MAFYYMTIFSLVPMAVAYGLLLLLFWCVVRLTRGIHARSAVLGVVLAVFIVLPISEESWIAWNFARACDEAGTFVRKQVHVAGFYDDTRTTHAGQPTADAARSFDQSGFQFLEMKGQNKVVRIDKVDGSWKSTVLDRPTARYHFRITDFGTPWAHNIVKTQTVVVDTETKEEIARYTRFGRSGPWYFVSTSEPPYACDGPGRWPLARGDLLVYESALTPTTK